MRRTRERNRYSRPPQPRERSRAAAAAWWTLPLSSAALSCMQQQGRAGQRDGSPHTALAFRDGKTQDRGATEQGQACSTRTSLRARARNLECIPFVVQRDEVDSSRQAASERTPSTCGREIQMGLAAQGRGRGNAAQGRGKGKGHQSQVRATKLLRSEVYVLSLD